VRKLDLSFLRLHFKGFLPARIQSPLPHGCPEPSPCRLHILAQRRVDVGQLAIRITATCIGNKTYHQSINDFGIQKKKFKKKINGNVCTIRLIVLQTSALMYRHEQFPLGRLRCKTTALFSRCTPVEKANPTMNTFTPPKT
jgi:hypothetical protein